MFSIQEIMFIVSKLISKILCKFISQHQNDLLEVHYREVENMYNQMRGWRHDYSNHIQVLKSYAYEEDIPSIKNYLNEIDNDFKTVNKIIRTGNKMTDAILNSKISLARSKNIPINITANIPTKLSIPEIELCIILGNIFDNAIEASLKLGEADRMIRIYMDMKGTQLYISFTNLTATKKLKKEHGIFKTSKGKGHGFGLIRVDEVVNRNHGFISRNSEDGAFTIEVLLPQDI